MRQSCQWILIVSHVSTHDQLAYILTKSLNKQRLSLLQSKIGVSDWSTILRGIYGKKIKLILNINEHNLNYHFLFLSNGVNEIPSHNLWALFPFYIYCIVDFPFIVIDFVYICAIYLTYHFIFKKLNSFHKPNLLLHFLKPALYFTFYDKLLD